MAGNCDLPWRFGSKATGSRSQFRLNPDGLSPFRRTYPIHLTDVMDAVPSTQSDLRREELLSPQRGTRIRAVREYEETIRELGKENFDLKLRLFLLEENQKNHQKNNGAGNDEEDNTVQVNVKLKVETEALQRELDSKEQLLQQALEQAEKYASDLKEIENRYVGLQEQLASFANVQEKLLSLKEEKYIFQKEFENLRNALSEKDQVIQNAHAQIEDLTAKNQTLETKVIKRNKAINGFVEKYHKEVEMIPSQLRPIVQGAVRAAKECKIEDLNAAVGEFSAVLRKIMPTSIQDVSLDKEQKENEDPTRTITASREYSPIKKDINQSPESMEAFTKTINSEDFEQMMNTLKDNENLRADIKDKSKIISSLNDTCSELERRTIQLQSELVEAVSKIKKLELKIKDEKSKGISSLPKVCTSVQTAVQWHLMQSKLSDSFLQKVGQGNNIEELKEEILRLLLVIEEKDKEISDIEREFDSLQSQIDNMDHQKQNSFVSMDMDDFIERNDLHQKLALSCQVNNELMEHLRKLETFMEDLLQNRNLDSSIENISEATDVFSRLTTCLDETKRLSNVLSGHLSICESSKLFDPDVSLSRIDYSHSDKQRNAVDQSRLSLNSTIHSTSQGRNNILPSIPESPKNISGTGKRRLSFSTLHNTSRIDSENAVFLSTSNNEDLILLLNDQGDPKDVLIRNSQSNHDASIADQHPRRCWESSTSLWNKEKSAMDQWCASELLLNKSVHNRCLSSDSDIWSEPDRDVSLQRIGIDVQKSPVSQKSPRRARLRDKRTTDELSSQKYESSSSAVKIHSWSKRRKSSDTLKSSFICKKCLSQSPSKDESPEKDRLRKTVNNLSNKCSKQENQLDEISEILESKIQLINSLNEEKQDLLNSIDQLEKEMKELKGKEKEQTVQTSNSADNLMKIHSENDHLRNTIGKLEQKSSESDAICEKLRKELEDTKTRLQSLDLKCSKYEEDIASKSKTLEDYLQKYNDVVNEKTQLLSEIGNLVSTKNELLLSIQSEKSKIHQLENENADFIRKLEEKSHSVLSMQSQFKELEAKIDEVSNEKEAKEKECKETLKNLKDLRTSYETELNRASKITVKVVASLQNIKHLLIQNLQKLIDLCKQSFECEEEMFTGIDKSLSGTLSVTDSGDQLEKHLTDITSGNTKLEQIINFISTQLNSFSSMKQLLEENNNEIHSLKILNNQLSSHIKSLQLTEKESKAFIKESKSNISFLHQDLKNAHQDIKDLKNLVEIQQTQVEDIQQVLHDKEKDLEMSKVKVFSSEVQLKTTRKQLEQEQAEVGLKNEEIDNLQKKILSLETQLSEVLLEKLSDENVVKRTSGERLAGAVSANEMSISSNFQTVKDNTDGADTITIQNRVHSKNSFPNSASTVGLTVNQPSVSNASESFIRRNVETVESREISRTISVQNQMSYNDYSPDTFSTAKLLGDNSDVLKASEVSTRRDVPSVRDSIDSNETSQSSFISLKDEEPIKNYDKYIKKIKTLKNKLYITEKRVEILEREKSNLREQLLAHGNEDIISGTSAEEVDSLKKSLSDLKAKLQEKTSFIRDLKSDMFRTCNSLIDKQKEVDNLKRQLSDSKSELVAEARSKSEDNLKSRFSDPIHMTTEENIKMLKKHKWELVHGILNQQKQFYERRNIHLGHLEKFKNHIEELRALQISPTMYKSGSEPLLHSFTTENNSYAEKCDKTLKNLQIELELDVECLQNFKIFLKRFFIPLVLQNCEQCPKHVDSLSKASVDSTDKDVFSPSKADSKWTTDRKLENLRMPSFETEVGLDGSQHSSSDRLTEIACTLAHKIDLIEHTLKSAKSLLANVKDSSSVEETPKKNAAKCIMMKILDEILIQPERMNEIFHLNSVLKTLGLFYVNTHLSHSKQDMSDHESLSEEAIPLSRSGSLSPLSLEEHLPFKSFSGKPDISRKADSHYQEIEKARKDNTSELIHKLSVGSRDSIFQRSHVSSPDQGIESDPNHESSAPEQAEKEESVSRLAKRHESGSKTKQWSSEKQLPTASLYSFMDSSLKLKDSEHSPASGDTLHAIGVLKNYELLKREVQESLVGIKSIISRTGDGLQQVAKYTSPRKNLEYSTFKAIRDKSGDIEVCLSEATKLVDKFWIAPCPTAEELNLLIQQNQELQEKLKSLEESKLRQEFYVKEAMAKLKQEKILKQKMDKKISKRLLKTKKVIQQTEIKLLEQRCQEPLVPKYPADE